MRKFYVSGALVGLLLATFIGSSLRPSAHASQVVRVVAQATTTPSGTCGGGAGGFC